MFNLKEYIEIASTVDVEYFRNKIEIKELELGRKLDFIERKNLLYNIYYKEDK